jgi:hypothetical protein
MQGKAGRAACQEKSSDQYGSTPRHTHIPHTVLDQWEWTAALPYNRWLWLSGSYLIFTTAVGGMVYCVIRSPPPFGMQQQRLHLFAMHTSQDQFVAEGLIMGVCRHF